MLLLVNEELVEREIQLLSEELGSVNISMLIDKSTPHFLRKRHCELRTC